MALKNGRTSVSNQTILLGTIIPVGTVQAFGGTVVPDGWLLCDGATKSRTTYSALYAAIGSAHGAGDGLTTFHLPDYRGRFLRGTDNMGSGAAGRDPGDNRTAANTGGNSTGLGSVQSDQFASHAHGVGDNNQSSDDGFNSVMGAGNLASPLSGTAGGTETRPKNANVTYIIKV
jgi:microcystin-dependent protein